MFELNKISHWLTRQRQSLQLYRSERLSDVEYSLIQDVLKNSKWYVCCLLTIFGFAFHALWGHVPTLWLWLFMVVFGIEATIKIYISQHFESLPREKQREPIWRLIFDAGSTYSGLAYGMASLVLFHPMPSDNRLLLIGAFCALIGNLSAAAALFTPVSRTMLPSLAAPVLIALAFSGNHLLTMLAVLGVVSIGCTLYLGRLAQTRYQLITRLNRDNELLVESLSEQQAIAAAQQLRAEEAVVEKSRFLATASHDLRQPLHALGLFHHALRLKSEEASNRQLFESIDKSTESLNAMFDSLLDVSRLDANVVEPVFRRVQLDDICSLLELEFAPVAREKGLQLTCLHLQARLVTDGTLLARILRNLIGNAIKFTEEGGVTVSAEQYGSTLQITISDTGTGIPVEEQVNVFSEFYQLGGGERFGTVGVGLGLSIVSRLCRLLDIQVTLEGGESGGTVATLLMACEQDSVPEKPAGRPPETPGKAGGGELFIGSGEPTMTDSSTHATADSSAHSSAKSSADINQDAPENTRNGGAQAPALQGRSILLIDDDPEIRQAMSNTLAQWGCLAICEPDVRRALARLSAMDIIPDLLICDFQLVGNGSGIDAIHTIHEAFDRQLPALLVSGATGIEETVLIAETGFQCLTKPVSAEDLRQVIEAMTGDTIGEGVAGNFPEEPRL